MRPTEGTAWRQTIGNADPEAISFPRARGDRHHHRDLTREAFWKNIGPAALACGHVLGGLGTGVEGLLLRLEFADSCSNEEKGPEEDQSGIRRGH